MKEIQTYTAKKEEGLLLNANERSDGLNENILDRIARSLPSLDFQRYPDDTCFSLRQAYADYLQIDPSCLLAGNGSDQILGLLIQVYLEKGKTLYTLDPDFGMYDYYASCIQAKILKFKTRKDGSLDVDQFIRLGKANNVDMILFSNPNNPTGYQVSKEDLKKILNAFGTIPIVIDEAYAEYGNGSIVDWIQDYSNLYVTRTLSKAFGLASLRIGFAVSDPQNISLLKSQDVPYVVNTLSQKVAEIVLREGNDLKRHVEMILQEKERYEQRTYKGLQIIPSKANFILVYVEQKELLLSMFEEENIQVRIYPKKDYIRITIGNPEENERVRKIFERYQEAI